MVELSARNGLRFPLGKWLAGVCVIAALSGCGRQTERVCVGKDCFSVEIVRREEDRARGLMFRKSLARGKGMFFVFEQERIYPFWMKNMQFPIDIIWINKDKKVVHVASNVPPCKADPCPVYTPSAKASYVLEIVAGDAARKGIRPGDLLSM